MRVVKWTSGVLVALLLAACGGGGDGQQGQQVTGTVSGTGGGTVMLRLISGDKLQDTTLKGDGSYSFPEAVGSEYFILVDEEPPGYACTALDAMGDATPREAKTVSCARTSFPVGGSVTSDPDIGDVLVEVRNSVNGDILTVASSGDFTFPQLVPADGNYKVEVASQTAGVVCSVANGSGVVEDEVMNVAVTCGPAQIALARPPLADVSAGVETTGFPPSGLKAVFSNQFIFITWDADSRSTYRVFEDRDGYGPGAAVHINDGYARLNGKQPVGNREWTLVVDPAQVLLTHSRARYSVQSCFNDVCSRVSDPVAVDFSQIPNFKQALQNAMAVSEALFHARDKELKDTVALRDKMDSDLRHTMQYYVDYRSIRNVNEMNDSITGLLDRRRQAQRTAQGVWELLNQTFGACSRDWCYQFLLNSI